MYQAGDSAERRIALTALTAAKCTRLPSASSIADSDRNSVTVTAVFVLRPLLEEHENIHDRTIRPTRLFPGWQTET